jgi:beta-phosphoglucomutase
MPARISLDGIKAAIFDMDGTMIDNMHYHKRAWQEFLKRHEIEVTEQEFKEKFSGQKNDKIIEMVFGHAPTPDESKRYADEKEQLYREFYGANIKEIDGLSECLSELRAQGIKTAIATTASAANREFALNALGLQEKFEVILGEEHVEHGKPSPEIYLKTAGQLNVEPAECLVFEDSPPGVRAGHDAGMFVIGVLSQHSKQELNLANVTIDNYTDVEFQKN